MTKEDLYKKIEFNGKYDTKIKTNLRNLIKENKEDKNLLPLLLEVQSELETGKAKTIYNKMLKKEDKEIIEPVKEIKKEDKEENNNIKKKYTPKEKKKDTQKQEKKKTNKKRDRKKKKSKGNLIAKIFIILFAILMIASSISTIFTYFR